MQRSTPRPTAKDGEHAQGEASNPRRTGNTQANPSSQVALRRGQDQSQMPTRIPQLHYNQVPRAGRFARNEPGSGQMFRTSTLTSQNQNQTGSRQAHRPFGERNAPSPRSNPPSQGSTIARGASRQVTSAQSSRSGMGMGTTASQPTQRRVGERPTPSPYSNASSQGATVPGRAPRHNASAQGSQISSRKEEGRSESASSKRSRPVVVVGLNLMNQDHNDPSLPKPKYRVNKWIDAEGVRHVGLVAEPPTEAKQVVKPSVVKPSGMTSRQNRNGLNLRKDEAALNDVMQAGPSNRAPSQARNLTPNRSQGSQSQIKGLGASKPGHHTGGRGRPNTGRGTPPVASAQGQIAKPKPVTSPRPGSAVSSLNSSSRQTRSGSSMPRGGFSRHVPVVRTEPRLDVSSSQPASVRTTARNSVRQGVSGGRGPVIRSEHLKERPPSSLVNQTQRGPVFQDGPDRHTSESSADYQQGVQSSTLSVAERPSSPTSSEMDAEFQEEQKKIEQELENKLLARKLRSKARAEQEEREKQAEIAKQQQRRRVSTFAQPTAASASKAAVTVKAPSRLGNRMSPSKGSPSKSKVAEPSKKISRETSSQKSLLPVDPSHDMYGQSSSVLNQFPAAQISGNDPKNPEASKSSPNARNSLPPVIASAEISSALPTNKSKPRFGVRSSNSTTTTTSNSFAQQTRPGKMNLHKLKQIFSKKNHEPAANQSTPTRNRLTKRQPPSKQTPSKQDQLRVCDDFVATIGRCVPNCKDVALASVLLDGEHRINERLLPAHEKMNEHNYANAQLVQAQAAFEAAKQALDHAAAAEKAERVALERELTDAYRITQELMAGRTGDLVKMMVADEAAAAAAAERAAAEFAASQHLARSQSRPISRHGSQVSQPPAVPVAGGSGRVGDRRAARSRPVSSRPVNSRPVARTRRNVPVTRAGGPVRRSSLDTIREVEEDQRLSRVAEHLEKYRER